MGFSLVVARRWYSLVVMCVGFSVPWLLCHKAKAPDKWDSVVAAPGLQSAGLVEGCRGSVAPRHVESSQIKDQTHVSCDGRQMILYH